MAAQPKRMPHTGEPALPKVDVVQSPERRTQPTTSTPIRVRKGDRVVFGSYAGTEVEVKGERYLVIRAANTQPAAAGAPAGSKSEKDVPAPALADVMDAMASYEEVDVRFRKLCQVVPDTSCVETPPAMLSTESAAFDRDFATLMATSSGQYAVYVGGQRVGVFETYHDALSAGYDATRGERPFLARRIEAWTDGASTWEQGRSLD